MPAFRRPALVRPSRVLSLAVLGLFLAGPRPAAGDAFADLQKQVKVAIEKGSKWLVGQRDSEGMFESLLIKDNEGYAIGVTCLCGLALLASGESKKDPGMLKTLETLLRIDAKAAVTGGRRTYDAGALLMFLTEMYRPEVKPDKDGGRYAKPKGKDPCGLPKEAAERVQELASWLVSVQLPDGWWRYPTYPPGDLSNTQYALLGLRAARDCGAAVPLDAFMKAMDQTLAQQEQDGPKQKRIIKGSGKPGESDYVVESGDRARGWKYQPDAGGITGSMTTAAIAVLAICRDALAKPTRYGAFDDDHDRRSARSVQDGFAWLDKNFTVERNPPGLDGWHYYYLYGLERACAFAGREAVGAHDWYVEGAKLLVAQQKPEGRWSTGTLGAKDIAPSDLLDTAWALLFLKKATRPTVPIPAPVITSGN
jgi:hypothetical protein